MNVTALAVILWGLAAILALVRPRAGAALIWVIPWLYPNDLLYGTLPLDIRFDDLFVVFVFLVCLVSPQARRTFTPLVGLALLWAVSVTIGEAVGLLLTSGFGWEAVVKNTGKALYVPMTAYVVASLLHREEHLERHLRWLGLAGALAGLLGIAMVYLPVEFRAFLIPKYRWDLSRTAFELIMESEYELALRAQGAVGTIALAEIAMAVGLLMLNLMIYHPHRTMRIWCGFLGGVSGVTLIYTNTRSAIGGVLVAVLWGVVFTRKRAALLLISGLGAVALVLQGGLLQRLLLRISGEAGPYGSTLWESAQVRLAIFEKFIDNFSVLYLVFGTGRVGSFIEVQASVHNAYIGALVYCGLIGAIVLAVVVLKGLSLGLRARRAPDGLSQALGTSLVMLVIAMLVQGMAAENFQQPLPMRIYFALMIFAQLRMQQIGAVTGRALRPAYLPHDPVVFPSPVFPRGT